MTNSIDNKKQKKNKKIQTKEYLLLKKKMRIFISIAIVVIASIGITLSILTHFNII